MGKATLKLTGTFEAWAPNVRTALLVRANGTEVPVLVWILEGRPANDATLNDHREEGRLLARLQHEHALRVEQTSGVGGQLAVVYENFDCVAVHHVLAALTARGQGLPARVAVEIAAAVGIALEEALKIESGDTRLGHRGPVPATVLLDTSGRVKLAGIEVLRPSVPMQNLHPGYAPPEGVHSWQAATWMAGALLVELLTGQPPPEGSLDPTRHEQSVRRAVLRVLSRPGDAPPEVVVAAIKQAMAHSPTTRGTPGAWGRMLRDVAVQLSTPGLRAWAPGTVPAVQKLALSALKHRLQPPVMRQAPTLNGPDSTVVPGEPLFGADDLELDESMEDDADATLVGLPLSALQSAAAPPPAGDPPARSAQSPALPNANLTSNAPVIHPRTTPAVADPAAARSAVSAVIPSPARPVATLPPSHTPLVSPLPVFAGPAAPVPAPRTASPTVQPPAPPREVPRQPPAPMVALLPAFDPEAEPEPTTRMVREPSFSASMGSSTGIPAPEPQLAPRPEPVPQPRPEPHPAPQLAAEPVPQIAAQPAPEPVPQIAAQPAPDLGQDAPQITTSSAPDVGQDAPQITTSSAPDVGQDAPQIATSSAPDVGQDAPQIATSSAPDVGQNAPQIAAPSVPFVAQSATLVPDDDNPPPAAVQEKKGRNKEKRQPAISPAAPIRPSVDPGAAGPSVDGPSIAGPSLEGPSIGSGGEAAALLGPVLGSPLPSAAVGSRPPLPASGPALGPAVGPALGASVAPLPLLDTEVEGEQTVQASLRKSGPALSPAHDPFGAPVASVAPTGPAPRAFVSAVEIDEPPRGSPMPAILVALSMAFVLAAVTVVAVGWWWSSQDDIPVTEVVQAQSPITEPTPREPPAAVAPESVDRGAPPTSATPPTPDIPTPAVTAAPGVPAPEKPTPPVTTPSAAAITGATTPAAPAAAPSAGAKTPAAAANAPSAPTGRVAPVATGRTSPADDAAPTRIVPTAPAPAPVPTAVATPPVAADVAGPTNFTVQFIAADPGLTLEVKCMVGSGSGTTVVIADTTRGNCRVVGRSESATVMALVGVTAERTYRCFEGGTRTCQ